MDVTVINANRQGQTQQTSFVVPKISTGKDAAAQPANTAANNLPEAASFTSDSLNLVNSKNVQVPVNIQKVDNYQQAQKIVKQLAKKIQSNPGLGLSAYSKVLASHLNALEV